MTNLEEVAHTDNESHSEFLTQEHTAEETRHVDVLLDISEQDFLKELEPYDYHSGWEEAVQGWARGAPLSCILLTQKRQRKSKHKEAENLNPLSVDPTFPNTNSSASMAEHHCESHAGSANSFKKSALLAQQMGSRSNTAVAALQQDASDWTVLNAMHKTSSLHLLEEHINEEGMLSENPLQPHHMSSKYSVLENRLTNPQKHSHRYKNIVVPIKNFTFLPPIKSPHLNLRLTGKVCSGKALDANSLFEKHEMRGTRVDHNTEISTYSADLMSKYQTSQNNLHLFSAGSVSAPKRYQIPLSSKPVTMHRTTLMGKSLTQALQSSNAVDIQALRHTSSLFS